MVEVASYERDDDFEMPLHFLQDASTDLDTFTFRKSRFELLKERNMHIRSLR